MRISSTRTGVARLLAAAPLLLAISACDDSDGDGPRVDAGSDAGRNDAGRPESDGAVRDDGGAPRPDSGDEEPAPMGDAYVLTSERALLLVDGASGEVRARVAITGVPEGEVLLGLDARPKDGVFYLLSDAAKLYTLDVTSGEAQEAATLSADGADASEPFAALSGAHFGVDFNPVADRLRVVSDTGQNLRINVDTGATVTDGAINPATPLRAAGYTQDFAAACRTQLFVLSDAGELSLQSPPNDGTLAPIGALGAIEGEVLSFDIVTGADGKDSAHVLSGGEGVAFLYDVSLTSGAASAPREITLEGDELVVGFAVPTLAEAPTQARGELLGLGEDGTLVSFQRGAPGKLCTSAVVTGLSAGEELLGIDVRPADGALYGLSSGGKLYTVDVASGAVTLKSTLVAAGTDATDPFVSLDGDAHAIGFNPVPDRLRVITSAGKNLRIDVDTGAVTTDTDLTPAGAELSALAYTNSFAGAKSTALYALDTAADTLVRVGSAPASGGTCDGPTPDAGNPNCGVISSIGGLALAADVSALNGFDIDAKNGVALAALQVGDGASSTLYAIDLATGAATLPVGTANGTIGGARLRGLVFAANPTLTAYGLTTDAKLVAFKVGTPGTLSVDVAVSGLEAGEELLGIDVRSANGQLYGLGSAGRLYTLDKASGAATLAVTLAAAEGDDAPYSALAAGPFAVDFNPVADLLRVIDIDGQNLRVAPSARGTFRAGDVTTDANLNPGTPRICAAAYTRAYAGTTSTTLYAVDRDTDRLYVQGGVGGTPSPNTGTLTPASSALSVDATGEVGFDITGGHDGLAALAITPAGQTRSQLYTLSLASGAATPFVSGGDSTIGAADTATLRALALDLQ